MEILDVPNVVPPLVEDIVSLTKAEDNLNEAISLVQELLNGLTEVV